MKILENFFLMISVAARKPTSGYEIKEKESVSQIFKLPSLDRQDTWYPTLRKTVWVLSQLHDFVKVRPAPCPTSIYYTSRYHTPH